MVTVPIRLTFSVEDEKKKEGPRHSSSESSSEESDASEESLPDLEKEMKEQILKRGTPTGGDPHVRAKHLELHRDIRCAHCMSTNTFVLVIGHLSGPKFYKPLGLL